MYTKNSSKTLIKSSNAEDNVDPIIAKNVFLKGGFLDFYVLFSILLHLPPLRFHLVGGCYRIEPRAIATLALAVRRFNYSARLMKVVVSARKSGCLFCSVYIFSQ
jgi:hypothetical protein